MEHVVDTCWICPFAEKRDWANEYDSGTDIEDCVLGMPKEIPSTRPASNLARGAALPSGASSVRSRCW